MTEPRARSPELPARALSSTLHYTVCSHNMCVYLCIHTHIYVHVHVSMCTSIYTLCVCTYLYCVYICLFYRICVIKLTAMYQSSSTVQKSRTTFLFHTLRHRTREFCVMPITIAKSKTLKGNFQTPTFYSGSDRVLWLQIAEDRLTKLNDTRNLLDFVS